MRPGILDYHGIAHFVESAALTSLKRRFSRRRGWTVPLCLGNAEELPFGDVTFDAVFHIGGINFFKDKAKAIAEMIRVAKPGTRIAICDENERGARAYERTSSVSGTPSRATGRRSRRPWTRRRGV